MDIRRVSEPAPQYHKGAQETAPENVDTVGLLSRRFVYDYLLHCMALLKRLASSLLLASGIVLVFAGLSTALGFTAVGILASIGVIGALLYAGGVWSAQAPPALAPAGTETVILFDRALRIAAGAAPGTPLLAQFPEMLRPEIEAHCRAALRGEHTHFACEHAGTRFVFDASPVQTFGGAVLYGALIGGAGARVTIRTRAPLPTVA